MELFVGDDWAEQHHDVELMDTAGRRLARGRLGEGVAGMSRLHAMIAEQLEDAEDAVVKVGIETDRGVWVQALIAAGTRCSRSTRCRPPATGSGTRSLAPRATRPTPIRWWTWSVPIGMVAAARKLLTLVYYGLRDGEIWALAKEAA